MLCYVLDWCSVLLGSYASAARTQFLRMRHLFAFAFAIPFPFASPFASQCILRARACV